VVKHDNGFKDLNIKLSNSSFIDIQNLETKNKNIMEFSPLMDFSEQWLGTADLEFIALLVRYMKMAVTRN
jgi:hypothetical protein